MVENSAGTTGDDSTPSPRRTARYGWIPDIPDARDFRFAAPPEVMRSLPSSKDLTKQMPAVYDQGDLGSCTANALGGAFEYDLLKQGLTDFMPSRLFIYYNERAIEGTTATDSGAMIRDGVKSLAKQGACPESDWPYDPTKFARKPPRKSYTDAKKAKVTSYLQVAQNLAQLKGCVASGYPVVIGFTVYESFESAAVASSGVVPMPAPGESVLGGHAVMVVGYDDASQRFRMRNSWGTGWGKKGYFTMPYAYLTDPGLSSDFWTLRVVA